jgi:hypothetical protein
MAASDRRRSPRHLLGQSAEIHLGPTTVLGVVHDVSAHGMGLVVQGDTEVTLGELIWVVVESVSPYAITGTVRRISAAGEIGIEFEEVLSGDALAAVESLPLVDPEQYHRMQERKTP